MIVPIIPFKPQICSKHCLSSGKRQLSYIVNPTVSRIGLSVSKWKCEECSPHVNLNILTFIQECGVHPPSLLYQVTEGVRFTHTSKFQYNKWQI